MENANSNYKLLPIKVPLYEFIKFLIIWLEKALSLLRISLGNFTLYCETNLSSKFIVFQST